MLHISAARDLSIRILPGMTPSLIARAKSLELDTPYVPPPGDPLEHHAAGFAKVMCSAVFVSGLDPVFAAEHVGYFTAPYEERARLGKPEIDRAARTVHVTLPNGVRRTAVYLGDQGCLTLPVGQTVPSFTPVRVPSRLPDPATQPWPLGDAFANAKRNRHSTKSTSRHKNWAVECRHQRGPNNY